KTLLKGNPGAFIDLLGFASKLGFASGGDSNQKNLELSKRRIAAVKQMILRHNPGTRFNVEDPKGSADDQGPRDDNDGFFRPVLVKVFGVKRPGETPVTPPTQSADIVVRYRGAEFNKRLSLEEVLPDPLIATYRAKHAADRTLTRIGAFTKTPQADDFLTEDLKKIQEVTKDKAVGKIC